MLDFEFFLEVVIAVAVVCVAAFSKTARKIIFGALAVAVVIGTCHRALAENVSATISGINFETNEVYAITKSGDIYSWFEDSINEDDILYGRDIVFDDAGEHIKMGCKALLVINEDKVTSRKLTGFVKRTQKVFELSYNDKDVIGYASDPVVAAYLMIEMDCYIRPIEVVY